MASSCGGRSHWGVALWGLAVWVSHRQPEHSVDVAHRLVELSELDVASIAIERDGNSLAATFTRPESVTIASSDGRPLVAAATASFFAALENTYTRRLLTGEPETERVRLGTEPGRASLTIVSNLKVTQILRLGTMVADGEVTWVSREQDGRVDLALISTTEAEGFVSSTAIVGRTPGVCRGWRNRVDRDSIGRRQREVCGHTAGLG